jgi:hypothetical protein
MLKQYPMLRYVLQKAFWYLLTFVCAVALNFALPRLGDNNPVDIIMGQAGKGLSPTEAQKKKAELLVSFGMAEVDENGNVIYEPETDANGNVIMQKVPKLDANGQPVVNVVKVVDEAGNPVMVERQKLDEAGNPVFVEKSPAADKGKKGKKEQDDIDLEIMEQVTDELYSGMMDDPYFFDRKQEQIWEEDYKEIISKENFDLAYMQAEDWMYTDMNNYYYGDTYEKGSVE